MKKSHLFLSALFVAVSFWPDASRAQNLYVGSNTPSNTLDLTSGTTSYVQTYIGFSAGSDSNALTVANPGTLLTNSNDLYVGNEGSGNSLTISNGGAVNNLLGRVGSAATSSNNSVLVTDTGSLWTTSDDTFIGEAGSGNNLGVGNAGTEASLDSSTLGYKST